MSISTDTGVNNTGQIFKVRLKSTVSKLTIIFDVTPDIIENRNVNYRTLEPVHLPGQIRAYQNTSSRTYNLSNIKIVSRSGKEASQNLKNLNLLRSWTMPYFGHTDDPGGDGDKNIGAPPDVLLLSAYSKNKAGQAGNIRNIPVVIQQLSIPYPSDVDYIPTLDGVPFPMLMSIDITLLETQSPRELHQFDLYKYRNGILEGY